MGTAYDDVTGAGRLANVVTAVTEATELSVSEKPHLPGDPTIAVLAVGLATKKDACIDPRWSMYVSRYQSIENGV
jgi:hypothetical protein